MNRKLNTTVGALVLIIAFSACAQKPNQPQPPPVQPPAVTGYDPTYHGPGSSGAIGNPPPGTPAVSTGPR